MWEIFKPLLAALLFAFCAISASAQILSFSPASMLSETSLPELKVKFKNENLFVGNNPQDKPRKYVFGGYTWRNWNKAISEIPYIDQYNIYLEHHMCGPGRYSVQGRLNNPPVWAGGTDDQKKVNLAAYNAGNPYRFSVPGKENSKGTVMARPCCPFADRNNKCCKKASDSTWSLHGWEDHAEQFWQCDTRHVCDNSYGYGDGNNRCTPVKTLDGMFRNSYFPYTPLPGPLQETAQFTAITNFDTSDDTCAHCPRQNVEDAFGSPDDKKNLPFYKLKMFCYEDNVAMKAHWGPAPKIIKGALSSPMIWTHDKYWTKDQQCKKCSDFGMMYFSMSLFNSVCLKVGPGESANAEGTAVVSSTVTANQYKPLVPYPVLNNGNDAAKPYTSKYMVIIKKHTEKKDTEIKVVGTRLLKGGQTLSVDTGWTTSCTFDVFSDYLRSNEIKASTSCKLNVDLWVQWPSQCEQSGQGSQRCSIIASVAKSSNLTNPNVESSPVPAGTGDTRLFSRVIQLGVKHSHDQSDPEATYYKSATYDGFLSIEGRQLVYELAVLVHRGDKGGCGRGANRYDQDAAYNTFTYYYPHEGNYDLTRVEPMSWVRSYKYMVKKQQAAMRQIATDAGSSTVEPMPVGNGETVAQCWKRRDGICNTDMSGEDQYEGLPAQKSSTAALGRGGEFTPIWSNSEYFSDFPNYDKNDVMNTDWGSQQINSAFQNNSKMWETSALRVAAVCVPCMAGFEGSRLPTLGEGSTVQTGRYIRATLGPRGEKSAAVFGIRATEEEYKKVCTPCLPGSYNPRPGGSCKRCPGGTFSMPTRRSEIPAFYASSAPSRCWLCLRGFHCPRMGRTGSLAVCSETKYGNMCPCPLNTYQNERGQQTCIPCPPNTATAQVGSISEKDCKRNAVPPGYRFKGPQYSTSNDIGSPQGQKWVPTLDAMQKVPCEKGSYSAFARLYSPSALECTPCGKGTYAPYEGSTLCYPCPLGEYTNQSGQTACVQCPCDGCGPGKPKPNAIVNEAKTKCTQAPVNYYSDSYTEKVFTPCPCGQYRNKGENKCRLLVSGSSVRDRIIKMRNCTNRKNKERQANWSAYAGFQKGNEIVNKFNQSSDGLEGADKFAIVTMYTSFVLMMSSLFGLYYFTMMQDTDKSNGGTVENASKNRSTDAGVTGPDDRDGYASPDVVLSSDVPQTKVKKRPKWTL